MPQDSLRSVVYKSFVTCDDPKGVVECGTIRKSKACAQKIEGKVESRKMPKNLGTSSSYIEERRNMASEGSAQQLNNPSSLQLMEVSRGADKLNHVIDSWSRGMSSEWNSTHVAKDLLKGALDLQESLVMFGKLQEASQFVARLKKKQKEKVGETRTYQLDRERVDSSYSYPIEYQKPRHSADGSSRDCYEELRRVISDGLAKQKLLANGPRQEKEKLHKRKKSDFSLHLPSDSSSTPSPTVCPHNFPPPDDSVSAKISKEKPKAPSLIAKLMGLEEMPSESLPSAPSKRSDSRKALNRRRPVADLDMPMAKKLPFDSMKMNPENRTLEEIIESMQCKGLLRKNSPEASNNKLRHSDDSNVKEIFTDEGPPIVIIKPMRLPWSEPEEIHKEVIIQEDRALSPDQVPGKWKMKQYVLSGNNQRREHALVSPEMQSKIHVEKPSIPKLSPGKDGRDSKVLGKPEVRKGEIKETLSTNKAASLAANSKLQRREATEKKIDKIQKVASSARKPRNKSGFRSIDSSNSHDRGKLASKRETNPETRSSLPKSRMSRQKIAEPSSSHRGTTSVIAQKSHSKRKNVMDEKLIGEPTDLKVENAPCSYDNLQIVDIYRSEHDIMDNAPSSRFEERENASAFTLEENFDNSSNSLGSDLLTSQHEREAKDILEVNCISQTVEDKSFRISPSSKDILLSSSSFITHAGELFGIETSQATVLQDPEIDDTRILVDCANEIMERKSLTRKSATRSSLQFPGKTSGMSLTFDQLAEDVWKEIENLRIYSESPGESFSQDIIYLLIERDLFGDGVICGAWDLGWSYGNSTDDVEKVVGNIGKLALNALIEETLADFILEEGIMPPAQEKRCSHRTYLHLQIWTVIVPVTTIGATSICFRLYDLV